MGDKDQSVSNDPGDDKALSALYRKRSQETPPPALDRAIKAAAADVLQAPSDHGGSPGGGRWQRPFVLAAVVVLCVSLAISVQREFDEKTGVAWQAIEPERADRDMMGRQSVATALDTEPPMDAIPEMPELAEMAETRSPEAQNGVAAAAPAPERLEAVERMKATPAMDKAPDEWITVTGQRLPEPGVAASVDRRVRQEAEDAGPMQRPATSPSLFAKDSASLPAEQQLADIAAFWEAGEDEVALDALAGFREDYPDYDVGMLSERLPPALLEREAELSELALPDLNTTEPDDR